MVNQFVKLKGQNMKIYVMSLFLGIAICLCFITVSCQGNSPDDFDSSSGIGETAYFSVSVTSTTGLSTRALQEETGVANELKINEVLLVLYHPATNKVAYQFPLDITSDGSAVVGGEDLYLQGSTVKRFQSFAREVDRQDYNLLVVANPREAIKTATAEGNDLSLFKAAATVTDVKTLTGNQYDHFLMCNWQDLVLADAATSFFSTEEEALTNPVTVYVERAVSKVMVDGPTGKDNAFSIEGWTLDVINKKTYWMRQPWLALNANGTGATVETESPNVAERYLNYAKDPNAARDQYAANAWHSYDAWLFNGGEGVAPASPNKDFTFISSASASWNTVGTANWLYVTENTMEAAQQYEDVATSIVLKATYHPAESALGAVIGTDTPYFTYYADDTRFLFTAEELEAEYTYQQNNGGETQTYTDVRIQEFMSYIELYRSLLGDDLSFTAYASAISNASCQLQDDFGFFDREHINYYRIAIPHFTPAEQPDPMGYGRYGVVRNNVYKLTVAEIYGPGKAEITPGGTGPGGDPDPEEPEDPDNPKPVDPEEPEKDTNWLSFEVRILDWTIRTSGVSAGYED